MSSVKLSGFFGGRVSALVAGCIVLYGFGCGGRSERDDGASGNADDAERLRMGHRLLGLRRRVVRGLHAGRNVLRVSQADAVLRLRQLLQLPVELPV